MGIFILFCMMILKIMCVNGNLSNLVVDYFLYKDIKYICYFSCGNDFIDTKSSKRFIDNNFRVSSSKIPSSELNLERFLNQWTVPVGVVLDGSCNESDTILNKASQLTLFDAAHFWLVMVDDCDDEVVDSKFKHLNLSIDADIAVARKYGDQYRLTDVFNFGKIQGNGLEKYELGIWTEETSLHIRLSGFKYYNRWDFHNLTLRAVSVILEKPKVFRSELLMDVSFTAGVAAMTKITAQLLYVLMQQHNFRFNYTIAGRWIGAPERNSTLAVTNSLFWREQDISCTCARIFPTWLRWVDIFFPPSTNLETKFYYLIPDKGVGDYENRFLTPMSPAVWWCACGALAVCAVVLAAAAVLEGRPKPGIYALFSVLAALCQQASAFSRPFGARIVEAYEDGVQLLEEKFSSQGRRGTLLVVGITSMLLYNYYTSSVVSWLLNAAAPSIASLEGLIASDLELVFEDIGYTRGWLDNPGFYYFSGYKNVKEDELREKKVTNTKRTTELLQPPEAGLELVRRGGYAYHTEPYTASQVIARRFKESELCALASLQMIKPAKVYIMAQKRSPYRQFFNWSLMRLLERGHIKVSNERIGGKMPACSGKTPRALALGQAAPAFFLLAQLSVLSVFILMIEILWHRIAEKNRRQVNHGHKK